MKFTHPLEVELNAPSEDILSAIDGGFRAKVDVKGKLAELYLWQQLQELERLGGIQSLVRLDMDGAPDFRFDFDHYMLLVECKNVRSPEAKRKVDSYRVELQKTRNSKDGTKSRNYPATHFDILAVCLFNRTNAWEYKFISSRRLARKPGTTLLEIMHEVPASAGGYWHDNILQAAQDYLCLNSRNTSQPISTSTQEIQLNACASC